MGGIFSWAIFFGLACPGDFFGADLEGGWNASATQLNFNHIPLNNIIFPYVIVFIPHIDISHTTHNHITHSHIILCYTISSYAMYHIIKMYHKIISTTHTQKTNAKSECPSRARVYVHARTRVRPLFFWLN